MSSELVDLLVDESKEDVLEVLLSEFTTLKKIDGFITVLSYYHVERCNQEDCSQCLFAINLRYVFIEHTVQEKKDANRLRYYCIMRKEQFIASRLVFHRLASLEKKGFSLKKSSKKL